MNDHGRGAGERLPDSRQDPRLSAPSDPTTSPPQSLDSPRSHTDREPHPSAQRPTTLVRRLLSLALACTLVAVLGRVAFLRGGIVPVVIAGPSMAETLRGQHWRVDCPSCRFTYRCAVERTPLHEPLLCPNCGHSHALEQNARLQSADHVWIDRWPTMIAPRSLTRGDLLALSDPTQQDSLAVKRLIGFPGELIEIREGDIWVNGTPWRKSWPEVTQQWIVVHDDRFRASHVPNPNTRWLPDTTDAEGKGWTVVEQGYQFVPRSNHSTTLQSPTPADEDPIEWLRFHPLAGHAAALASKDEQPIRDLDTHNPDTSRPLSPVTDLALEANLRLDDNATCVFHLENGRETLRFEFRASGQGRAGQWKQHQWIESAEFVWRENIDRRDIAVTVAQYDRQWFVVTEGRVLASQRLPLDVTLKQPALRPWSVGAVGGRVDLRGLRILRDIYYTIDSYPTDTSRGTRQWKLGEDDWFLLGDNPAVSVDSRVWKQHPVHSRHLYGRVGRWRNEARSAADQSANASQ